jgi:hypothetical protein
VNLNCTNGLLRRKRVLVLFVLAHHLVCLGGVNLGSYLYWNSLHCTKPAWCGLNLFSVSDY